jgi:hypothetical protein
LAATLLRAKSNCPIQRFEERVSKRLELLWSGDFRVRWDCDTPRTTSMSISNRLPSSSFPRT